MAWFKREKKGITTPTTQKKETPEVLWYKTPTGKIIETNELRENLYVSPEDDYHVRIGSEEYFHVLFDEGKYTEINKGMRASDPLKFEDTKKYVDRLKSSQEKTGLKDAIRTAHGKLDGQALMIACMDFAFIGGSMGAVVGEKISLAIDHCLKHEMPLMIISKSGGARMMEAGFSLMQMAKTSAKLSLLAEKAIPYISLLTDPTTGGVTASYAMLGDVNIAEPKALIGFAGPRVIKETIGKDLPEGFQTSEFLLEHGFLDFIVHRKEMKEKLSLLLKLFKN